MAEVYPTASPPRWRSRGLTDGLEGAHRGHGHFDGVTTVVTKLLNMVGPDVAYFGQKDAQQAAVIRRLVRDLNFPVRIEVCPTVRADDGLALSSRNVLLSAAERARATALHRALRAVQAAVAAGERDPDAATAAGHAELAAAGVEPEYLAIVAAETMEPVATHRRRRPGRGRRPGRQCPPDRQRADNRHGVSPEQYRHRHHGGDPARGANHLRRRKPCPQPPTPPFPRASTGRCR